MTELVITIALVLASSAPSGLLVWCTRPNSCTATALPRDCLSWLSPSGNLSRSSGRGGTADAANSKSVVRKDVGVQVSPPAPIKSMPQRGGGDQHRHRIRD